MEFNKDKDDARRAMVIAEKKLSNNDYVGAKKFINMAQKLYPELDGLEQVSTMIHVYITARNKTSGRESDWYRVLGVDPLADDEAVKKQYKKLALLLHPDKNKRKGAEGAFKLVLEAWCLLSDKANRISYDQRRKSKTVIQKPTPNGKPKPPPPSVDFWTMCNKCKTRRTFSYDRLNNVVPCSVCGQNFIATVHTPWSSFEKQNLQQQQEQMSAQKKAKKGVSSSWRNCSPSASNSQEATNNNISGDYSSSVSANVSEETPQTSLNSLNTSNQDQERKKRAFDESQESTILKKQRQEWNKNCFTKQKKASKLVLRSTWSLLFDKAKRSAYSKGVKHKKREHRDSFLSRVRRSFIETGNENEIEKPLKKSKLYF